MLRLPSSLSTAFFHVLLQELGNVLVSSHDMTEAGVLRCPSFVVCVSVVVYVSLSSAFLCCRLRLSVVVRVSLLSSTFLRCRLHVSVVVDVLLLLFPIFLQVLQERGGCSLLPTFPILPPWTFRCQCLYCFLLSKTYRTTEFIGLSGRASPHSQRRTGLVFHGLSATFPIFFGA